MVGEEGAGDGAGKPHNLWVFSSNCRARSGGLFGVCNLKRFSDSEKLLRGGGAGQRGKGRAASLVLCFFLRVFFLAKSAAKCLAEYFKCTRSCCSCSPCWRCRRSRRVAAFPLRCRQTTTMTTTATIINDGYFIIVELKLEQRLQFGQRIRRSRKRISWPFLIVAVAVAAGAGAGAEAGAIAGADAVNPSKS